MAAGRVVILLSPLVFLAGFPPASGQDAPSVEEARTVAIGDVHGDFKTLYRLLRDLKLITRSGHWSGGERRLVQTGDLLDRGPDSKKVMQLFKRLEKEARAAGGDVTVILGNHEAMNLTSDFRYVSAGEFAAFAAKEKAAWRDEAREEILTRIRDGSPLLKSDYYRRLAGVINDETFDMEFPRGCFALMRAFSPQGGYGKWLLGLPAVVREGGFLFVHAGISPRFSRLGADELNRLIREGFDEYHAIVGELQRLGVFHAALGSRRLFDLVDDERLAGGPHADLAALFRRLDALAAGPLFNEDGPLWYRGLAEADERTLQRPLEQILERHGVERIVIGHTQHVSLMIQGRFNNRVLLIDTGLNQEVYQGTPSALLIFASGAVEVFE